MPDDARLEELRRRVEKDPASIAFAQLAEEYRRAGAFEDAIRVCRTGLEQHPGYISARVTLGRALLETGQYQDAQAELEFVLRAAPDNLAAIRTLADLHQRTDGDETFLVRSQTPEVRGREEPVPQTSDPDPPTSDLSPPTSDPVLTELERWLAAILFDREARHI